MGWVATMGLRQAQPERGWGVVQTLTPLRLSLSSRRGAKLNPARNARGTA